MTDFFFGKPHAFSKTSVRQVKVDDVTVCCVIYFSQLWRCLHHIRNTFLRQKCTNGAPQAHSLLLLQQFQAGFAYYFFFLWLLFSLLPLMPSALPHCHVPASTTSNVISPIQNILSYTFGLCYILISRGGAGKILSELFRTVQLNTDVSTVQQIKGTLRSMHVRGKLTCFGFYTYLLYCLVSTGVAWRRQQAESKDVDVTLDCIRLAQVRVQREFFINRELM